jgi:hypothetical protein
MAKKSNQKIKLLYLMKILLENTDDEHGMTLAEISRWANTASMRSARRSTTTLKCFACLGSISTREKAKA